MPSSMDKDIARKVEVFRENATKAAEDIIYRLFPEKILLVSELTELIESSASVDSLFHLSHLSTDSTVYPPPSSVNGTEEPDAKKRKRTTEGSAPSIVSNDLSHARYPNLVHANQHLAKLASLIKKEAEQLAELCDKVKIWVNLTMPKIEDGDNFGVQVQEEVLTELHRSQESAYNFRDGVRQEYLTRAKICSKIIKYPHIEDYALALKEHDEKSMYSAKQHIIDIRNVYAIITDILHKNMVKIRAPKGNNGMALY